MVIRSNFFLVIEGLTIENFSVFQNASWSSRKSMASYQTNEYLCRFESDVYRWFVHFSSLVVFHCALFFFSLGTVRVDDSIKYPIPRFGYPPLKRPQHRFSASYNDLSVTSTNPTTQSLNATTWSNVDGPHQRPTASQHSNRFQHYSANNGFDVRQRNQS